MIHSASNSLRSFGAAFALLAALAAPERASAVGLMVNEFRVGTGSADSFKMADDEFIEFVLTTNATASELASLTFGDTNHQTSRLNSIFRFDQSTLDLVLANAGATSFLAGTFIVVKGAGLGSQNLSYNPLSSNRPPHTPSPLHAQGQLDPPPQKQFPSRQTEDLSSCCAIYDRATNKKST